MEHRPKGRTLEYRLTTAGRDLQPVVQAIGEWGATWSCTEPRPEELDPDLLIVWMARHVDRRRLPPDRTVDVDLEVAVDTTTLHRLYLGRAELDGALRAGQLTVSGPRTLQCGFGEWFTWSAFAQPAARRMSVAQPPHPLSVPSACGSPKLHTEAGTPACADD